METIQLPKPVGRAGPVCKGMAMMWEKLRNKTQSKTVLHFIMKGYEILNIVRKN